MEKAYQMIPAGKFIPYTLDDLSVVIPQASQYVKRIQWFIPQYIEITPSEVIKNTVVIYDPKDIETKAVLDQYGIKGITTTPPHSTYKLQAGFDSIKTRLVVRMHNDAFVKRADWAEALIVHFNQNPQTQLIGALNISGGIGKETMDKLLNLYPAIKPFYDQLNFSEGEHSSIGAPFFSAHFMAAQTYLFKTLQPMLVELNEGSMNKEDVLTTIWAALLGAKIVSWNNLYSYVANVGAQYGDFEEGFILPSEIDTSVLQAEFREVNG